MEGERRLVAVVSVGDQELEVADVGAPLDAPQPVAAHLEVGRALGNHGAFAVV
jgi:hypothetical protein